MNLEVKDNWHIWVVKQHKSDYIRSFLEKEVPSVTDVFFPTVPKEYKTGNRIYKRRIPLYSGYLFLKYPDDDKKVFYSLKACPFFSRYVGVCDNFSVEEMKKKESWNTSDKKVDIGDKVEVISGPFCKCRGVVHAINGNKITIKTTLFGRDIDHVLSSDDLEIVGR